MKIENYKRDNYLITTDPEKTDLEAVCEMLKKSYWANNREKSTIARSMKNSLCFNLYLEDKQIGIARMVTDQAVYGYLCDVYIEEAYRGNGLGKWLLESILAHPIIKELAVIDLGTRNAQEFYRKYGFTEAPKPQNIMKRFNPKLIPPK